MISPSIRLSLWQHAVLPERAGSVGGMPRHRILCCTKIGRFRELELGGIVHLNRVQALRFLKPGSCTTQLIFEHVNPTVLHESHRTYYQGNDDERRYLPIPSHHVALP